MSYEEKMQEIEYYILEHYGIYGVGMFNIMCGIAMGTTAFAVIYIIVPTISAFVILCVCSVVYDMYIMFRNAIKLVKNIYNGIVSELKVFIDGLFIAVLVYFIFTMVFDDSYLD
tara:strand:+ start:173 stop:514 length:342 start_codon:yes stop_codon:yes gene_type:complete